MRRCFAWVGGLVLGMGLFLVPRPAFAVIMRLTPLKEVLAAEQLILVARVEALDPTRPSLVLKVDDPLKGKPPFARVPVNMTGDSEGQKEKHPEQMFKRLATDLPVVIFASSRGKKYTAFGYTNGTWFQMIGTVGDEPGKVAWAFTHCEPYLRRTFKGTSAELVQTIKDGLAGTKAPPDPNPKEEPGLGPEIESKKGVRRTGGPVFAVIPTFVIMGPLALLATLFPAVFGGLALFMRRWLAFLSTACFISTLFLLQWWLGDLYLGRWWGSPAGLWLAVALTALAGALWAAWRYRAELRAGTAKAGQPGRRELLVLGLTGLIGLGFVGTFLAAGRGASLLTYPWRELLLFIASLAVGGLYLGFRRLTHGEGAEQGLPTEVVALWALVFFSTNLLALEIAGGGAGGSNGSFMAVAASDGQARRARPKEAQWFDSGSGSVISSPLVIDDRMVFAAIKGAGFSTYGMVYCLHRDTREVLWTFADDGELKQIYSTPCIADGRLYFGEGLHENRGCRFFCLDASSGKKLWDFETNSHTESSPCVADGKVYFGAGDDGVYCLDAVSGQKIWQYQRALHVDANPVVAGGRLYCGSGVSRTYKDTCIFCLDAAGGKEIWREPVPLPAWGAPTVAGPHVFFGIGNGRLDRSDDQPAGAVLCVEGQTGRKVWQHDLPDGVLVQPAVDHYSVYAGCRDGFAYCLDRRDGQPRWKQDLGSPIVANLKLVKCSGCDATTGIFAIASGGQVGCLDPASGTPQWKYELTDSSWKAQLYSSPAVLVGRDGDTERRRYFFGAGLVNPVSGSVGRVYCLEDQY